MENKNPFPAECVSRFPILDVLGQLNESITKEDIEKFLRDHNIDVEFVSVNIVRSEDPKAAVEGAALIKVKGVDNTAIVPFGMMLAVAQGVPDYMVIHPQVFLTFYGLRAQETTQKIDFKDGQPTKSKPNEPDCEPTHSAPVTEIDAGELP